MTCHIAARLGGLALLLTLAGCPLDAPTEPDATPPCDGAAGCPCADAPCAEGLVCDGVSARCRPPVTCDALPCVAHQTCGPTGAGPDAVCQPACAPGWDWHAAEGICRVSPPGCLPDHPRSIAEVCAAERRACREVDGRPATCGGCLEGLVADGGQCRAPVTCAEVGPACAAEGRPCVEDGGDARCGACPDGTSAAASGACVAATCAAGARGSIAARCATLYRLCDEGADDGGARCGACLGGHVDDGAEACRPVRDCAAVDCALDERLCVWRDPATDATCGACRAGFDEVDGRCVAGAAADCDAPVGGRALREACADEGRVCVDGACGDCLAGRRLDPLTARCDPPADCAACAERGLGCAQDGGDTRCDPTACPALTRRDPQTGDCAPVVDCDALACAAGEVCAPAVGHADAYCRRDCGEAAVWNGVRCAACGPCDRPGDTGRIVDRPTLDGECICETRDGYFTTRTVEVGSFPCDADGDGWLRESAREAMRSLDPLIRSNARCSLRSAHTVALVNEHGTRHEVPLDAPLDLYESDRNDDDGLLADALAEQGIDRRFGGPGGPVVGARHLDGLTKLCHRPVVDYNDNGVADVDEAPDQEVVPGGSLDQAVFNRFAYFAELHRSHFEPDGVGGRGTYVITERSRQGEVALGAGEGADPYWRLCRVRRDADWERPLAVGMDLAVAAAGARVVGDGWPGMNHHSLFKCAVITDAPAESVDNRLPVAYDRARWALARCAPELPADEAPGWRCEPDPDVQPGDVRWATALFAPYADDPGAAYVRGCVDECAELRDGALPGNPCGVADDWALSIGCRGDEAAFGRLICEEMCDGLDNTGDGVVDRPPARFGALDSMCASGGVGVCGVGRVGCADGVFACVPVVEPADVAGAPDLCDGLDNNCDGRVDEDARGPRAPAVGEGGPPFEILDPCPVPGQRGACSRGDRQCIDGGLRCVQVFQPTPEVCDGVDNSCDGAVDGGLDITAVCGDPAATACNVPGGAGACARGLTACQGGAEACVPLVSPGQYPEVCNGVDDDCDGGIDEAAGGDPCLIVGALDTGEMRLNLTAFSGDGEFDDNGPRVRVAVRLSTTVDGVVASLTVDMDELRDGDTHGVYRGEHGVDFGQAPGTVQLLTSSLIEVEYTDDDHERDTVAADGGLRGTTRLLAGELRDVVELSCVGDSRGTDVRRDDEDEPSQSRCSLRMDVRVRRVVSAAGDCGNGAVEGGEQCDDGNRCAGDGCSPLCTRP